MQEPRRAQNSTEESKSPTNCLQCYSYSPQPHTTIPYVPSTQPHFPQRPGQEVHAGSSTHVSMSSYWEGSTAPKDVSFHRGHRARKRTLGNPCLQCHPLGTLVPLGVDVRCVVWWEWGQGVHSQRVLVTLNHHRCEPGKRGKGQEASVIHGIGCQPRTNGILVFLGAGLTALIPITVVWTRGLAFINLFNSSWSSLPQLRRTNGESSENMQVSQHSNLSSIHLTVLSWNQR